jgi:hypothetical protein
VTPTPTPIPTPTPTPVPDIPAMPEPTTSVLDVVKATDSAPAQMQPVQYMPTMQPGGGMTSVTVATPAPEKKAPAWLIPLLIAGATLLSKGAA